MQVDLENIFFKSLLRFMKESFFYPSIPVTRKLRLPWILVQFMKLSMLRASTVSLFESVQLVPWQTGKKSKDEKETVNNSRAVRYL